MSPVIQSVMNITIGCAALPKSCQFPSFKDGDVAIGRRAKVKVVKNKVAPPFRVAEFVNIFCEGIDWATELVELGVENGFVEKAGAWYSYNGEKIGQGVKNAAAYFSQHLDDAKVLDTKLREKLFGGLARLPKESEETPAAEVA